MKIKMLTLQAGPDVVRQAGKVYDVPTKEAESLIVGGYAVQVDAEKPKPVAAPTPKPRAATQSRGRTADKKETDPQKQDPPTE
jgi:hypothetical protein